MSDEEAIEAARTLARNEGIIPALESAHALAELIDARAENEEGRNRDPESFRPRRQRHGNFSFAPCLTRHSEVICRRQPADSREPARRPNRAALCRACESGRTGAGRLYHGGRSVARRRREKIVLAAAEAGADVIELGVPFSDPVADGPTIQRASERALAQRHHARGRARSGCASCGRARKCRWCSSAISIRSCRWDSRSSRSARGEAGVDGVLATDLTPEEAGEYREVMHARGLDTIFLARADFDRCSGSQQIAECSSGFLYLISRTGVTGSARFAARRVAGAGAAGAALHEAADCGRLRDFAAGARVACWAALRTRPWWGRRWWRKSKRPRTPTMPRHAVAERIRLLKEAARRGNQPAKRSAEIKRPRAANMQDTEL